LWPDPAIMDRLETLRRLVTANPRDTFAHYALGMALAGAGQFEEALAEFGTVLSLDEDYTVTYYQAGQALERLGRQEEAREMYRRGVEITGRLGQHHARDQLEGALALLG
jgi:Flp pilus assembly protein TadD